MLLELGLFVVALLYAAVGHGGASGYIALLVLMGYTMADIRPTTLVLNVLVASLAFARFYRAGHFRWDLFWPLAVASVPLAALGGLTVLSDKTFKILLGVALLIVAARMLWQTRQEQADLLPASRPVLLGMGGSIGYLSGLLGIGGGIILSPLLLILRYATMKETAAVSALFIVVNSLAGLGSQVLMGVKFHPDSMQWIAAALLGGVLGSWLGAQRLSSVALRWVLAIVLLVAVGKLMGV